MCFLFFFLSRFSFLIFLFPMLNEICFFSCLFFFTSFLSKMTRKSSIAHKIDKNIHQSGNTLPLVAGSREKFAVCRVCGMSQLFGQKIDVESGREKLMCVIYGRILSTVPCKSIYTCTASLWKLKINLGFISSFMRHAYAMPGLLDLIK